MQRNEESNLIEDQSISFFNLNSIAEVAMSSSAAGIGGSISGTAISALFCSAASLDSYCIGVGSGIGALSGMLTWCGAGSAALVNKSFYIPGFVSSATISTISMMGVSYALNINPITIMGYTAAGSAIVGALAGAAMYDNSKKLLRHFSVFKLSDSLEDSSDNLKNNTDTQNKIPYLSRQII